MKALCFDGFGGPDVMHYRELPEPEVGPGQALVQTRAIGLNFADIYRRRGNYHQRGKPPYIAGYEAAGLVESAPLDSGFRAGDRVAFADAPHANAERVAVNVAHLIRLPDEIALETAAATLLQGLTAQYLVRDSHPLKAGESVLVHAAAGGVGLLLVQIARSLGARVLGVVSTEEKAIAAREAGAQIVAPGTDWVQAAREFGGGTGVDVVFDSIGTTILRSLEATRAGGRVVFYGMAGGDPPAIDPRILMDGSRSVTGGDLWNVLTCAAERQRRANELFGWLRSGQLNMRIAAHFPLSEGAAAHTFLESRRAIGKVLLIP